VFYWTYHHTAKNFTSAGTVGILLTGTCLSLPANENIDNMVEKLKRETPKSNSESTRGSQRHLPSPRQRIGTALNRYFILYSADFMPFYFFYDHHRTIPDHPPNAFSNVSCAECLTIRTDGCPSNSSTTQAPACAQWSVFPLASPTAPRKAEPRTPFSPGRLWD